METVVNELRAADSRQTQGVTAESRAAFDYTCRYYLKMSGKQFLSRLDAGEFNHDTADPRVQRVLSMLPFAR